MDTKTDTQKLLQDLRQVPEESRDQLVKLLPQEALVQLLKAALIELDMSQQGDGLPEYTVSDKNAQGEQASRDQQRGQSLVEERDLLARLKNPSTAVKPTKEHLRLDAVVPSGHLQPPPTEPRNPDPKTDALIKIEKDNLLARIGEYDSDEEHDRRTWEVYSISITSANSERTASLSAEPPVNIKPAPGAQKTERQMVFHIAQPKPFPVMLSVPVADGGNGLKSINELPLFARDSLQKRFQDMCSATENRRMRYARIRKRPKTRRQKDPVCPRRYEPQLERVHQRHNLQADW